MKHSKNSNVFHSSNPNPVKGFTGHVGSRSYAEVAGANKYNKTIPPPPPPPPILATSLYIDKDMERWIQKTTLIGEVISLDHLGNLRTLLSIHSDIVANMKYAGRIKVILSF
ncbi:unnamed protein product [Lactuca virosa]|uniref:Uncharacterized protein n=1 Tax=Lactuca virosa TaxID=75947 RepID=A0AAU9NVX7_9ASTR|nr:unnamed protein product [Lactuca virosa]